MAKPIVSTHALATALFAIVTALSACSTSGTRAPLSSPRETAATSRQQATRDAAPATINSAATAALPPVPPAPPPVAETHPLRSDAVPGVVAPTSAALVAPASDTLALVLPLDSRAYGPAADAVKAGFIAAAERAASGKRVEVIGHGDDGVLPAFATASASGAALVVGPLTRDDLKTVIAMAAERPRMLALNQSDDGAPLPADAYTLSLAVDSDAVYLAQLMRDDGIRAPVKVVSSSPLQRRFASAFSAEWERGGGPKMRDYAFDPNPEALGTLRRELIAHQPDAILLAVDGQDAALTKAFLPPVPVYASSQIADGLAPEMLRDLEGVRYVEIPWIASPDDPEFAGIPRGPAVDALSLRLYALGLDAFALAQMLASPTPPDRVELDGATGHLSLAPTRNFVRKGTMMIIRGGHAVTYQMPP